MKNNVSQTVRRVVAKECGLKFKTVSSKTQFMTQSGPAYFDCMGAMFTLQHVFRVDLPESKYQEYETVGDLTKDIIRQLKRNRTK